MMIYNKNCVILSLTDMFGILHVLPSAYCTFIVSSLHGDCFLSFVVVLNKFRISNCNGVPSISMLAVNRPLVVFQHFFSIRISISISVSKLIRATT